MITPDPPSSSHSGSPESDSSGESEKSGVTRNRRGVRKEQDSPSAMEVDSSTGSRKRQLDKSESLPARKSARTTKPVKHFEAVDNPVVRASTIQWVSAEVTEEGRILVPSQCLRAYKKHRLDAEQLRQQAFDAEFIPMVHSGPSKIEDAGKGVFASRDFQEGELVGFYQGRLTRHMTVSDDVVQHYSDLCKANKWPEPPENSYATWYETHGKTHFLQTPDSHILWSGIEVEQEKIELGIDGLKGGNALACLNHSDDSNVKALPTFSKKRSQGRDNDLFIRAGHYSEDDLLIPVVANRPIKADEELTMTYRRPTEDPIDFTKVGNNIFSAAKHYFTADKDGVKSLPLPSAADFSSHSLESSDFEETFTREEERLARAWCQGKAYAQKKLVDAIQAGDERMLDIFIFLCLKHQHLTPSETVWSVDRVMGQYFRSASELRDYIRSHFSSDDAARMLSLRNVPGEKEREPEPSSSSRRELKELLTRFRSDGDDAKDSLRDYLFCRLYCSDVTLPPADQHLFAHTAQLLKKTPCLMGKRGKDWDEAALYQFALDDGIFLNDEDRIAFMPLSYLSACFDAAAERHKEGMKALNEYVHYWVSRGDPLYVLASLLSRHHVPNAVEPGAIWTEKHLLELRSMRLLYARSLTDDEIKDQITIWLDNRNTKEGRTALQTIKSQLLNGSLEQSRFFFLMKASGQTYEVIYKAVKPFAKQYGLGDVKRDAVQEQSYGYMAEETSFQQQAENLGNAIRVIVQRFSNAGDVSEDEADALITQEELEILQKELRTALEAGSRIYSIDWYGLLRDYRIPCLHRILLGETVRTKDLNRAAKGFTGSRLPRYAPDQETHPTEWKLKDVIQNLYDNEIYDIRGSRGQHMAVMMAGELRADMRFLSFGDKPFEEWLEGELNEHSYGNRVIKGLREQNYDAAAAKPKPKRKKKGER